MSAQIHTHSFTVQWKHVQHSGNLFMSYLTPANQVIVRKRGKNFKPRRALRARMFRVEFWGLGGLMLLLLCVRTAGLNNNNNNRDVTLNLGLYIHSITPRKLARGCHLLKAVGEEIKRGGSILSCHCQEDERMALW